MSLIERLEAGKPEEQKALLVEWFDTMHPKPNREDEPEWQGAGTLREPLYHHWKIKHDRFHGMLDCGAFLDAVMLLVPEGCLYSIRTLWDGVKTAGNATVFSYAFKGGNIYFVSDHSGTASTPALALAAAILKTEETRHD